jgi:hypothetical protein
VFFGTSVGEWNRLFSVLKTETTESHNVTASRSFPIKAERARDYLSSPVAGIVDVFLNSGP